MKQILTHLFVALGVIFLICIIFCIVFIIKDPYNLKPIIFGSSSTGATYSSRNLDNTNTTSDDASAVNGEFYLSDQQKQALTSFGIDPTAVPSTINLEQENCFVSVLGEARVNQIKSGAVPNAMEFLKAKACI